MHQRSTLPGSLLFSVAVAIAPSLVYAQACTFTATSPADLPDVNPGDGVCEDVNGACTLRAAIDEVNQGTPAVVCLGGTTYLLTLPGTDNGNAAGDIDIYGANVTIVGVDPNSTIIDGNRIDRVFDLFGTVVTMSDLTIRGGQPGGGLRHGGGIRNGNLFAGSVGDLTLTNVIIEDNATSRPFPNSSDGGGIFTNGSLIANDVIVRRNSANGQGGGLAFNDGSTADLTDVVIEENNGDERGGGAAFRVTTAVLTRVRIASNIGGTGGGISSAGGNTTIIDCNVLDNQSGPGNGGGGIAADGVMTIRNTTISGNTASMAGGGIINAGTLAIDGSTLSGNESASFDGGGIHNMRDLTAVNCTISGNRALSGRGGGVSSAVFGSGAATLNNVTVAFNQASSGGGVATDAISNGLLGISNSIVADNTPDDCDDPLGLVASDGHNLDTDGTCPLTGPGDRPNGAAVLGALQYNGGLTQTHELLSSSGAIDTGHQSGAGTPCASADQRGVSRPVDGDGNGVPVCDMGAYEADQPTGGGIVARVFFEPAIATVAPGNEVTLQVFVEETVPGGISQLNTYQITLAEFATPLGGSTGSVVHDPGLVLTPSPFIDTAHPEYAFAGVPDLPATNPGPPPAFGSVALAPVAVNPRAYLGEVTYIALPTASGSFELHATPVSTFLLDANGQQIFTTNTPADIRVQEVDFNLNTINMTASDNPHAIAAGDWDADGDEDLAVVNALAAGSITIFDNLGSGTFQRIADITFGAGTNPRAIVSLDFDADGFLDLAIVNDNIVLFQNDGTGGFGIWFTLGMGFGIEPSLVAGDFNNDCLADIVGISTDTVGVWDLSGGSPTFDGYTVSNARDVAGGDMDGDGDLDLVVADASLGVSVLLQGPSGFSGPLLYSSGMSGPGTPAITLGDWDNDGDLDVAVTADTAGTMAILRNDGIGGLLPGPTIYGAAQGIDTPFDIVTADFDGDRDLDLALTNSAGPNSVQVMANDGSGNFSNTVSFTYPTVAASYGMAVADFNYDGTLDIAAAFGSQQRLGMLLNDTNHDCNGNGVDDRSETVQGAPEFVIVGASDMVGWPWSISNGAGYFAEVFGTGRPCVAWGQGPNAFALTFVESINRNSCPSIRAQRVAGRPDRFRIRVPGPTATMCVGPAGVPAGTHAGCCLTQAGSSCSFNPDLILTGGLDCMADADCDDANLCTVDICNASGVCVNTPAVVDDGNDCTDDTCNPATGLVEHVPSASGTVCDNGNPCTINDVCDGSGNCQGEPVAPATPRDADGIPKNRYLSIDWTYDDYNKPLQCSVTSPDYPDLQRWIGVPDADGRSRLECAPVCIEPAELPDVVYVGDEAVVPESTYRIEVAYCDNPECTSPPLTLETEMWGDINGDGIADFADIMLVVRAFQSHPEAPSIEESDLAPESPDANIDFGDILEAVNAFKGRPHPYGEPGACGMAATAGPAGSGLRGLRVEGRSSDGS